MKYEEIEFNEAFENLSAEIGHAINGLVREFADRNPMFDDIVVLSMMRSKIADVEAYCLAHHGNFCDECNDQDERSPEDNFTVEDD